MDESTLAIRSLVSMTTWIAVIYGATLLLLAVGLALDIWRLGRLEKAVDGIARQLSDVIRHGTRLDEHQRRLDRHDEHFDRLKIC